jgi:hypothetical protein
MTKGSYQSIVDSYQGLRSELSDNYGLITDGCR